jgi:hypothetical protein
MEENQEKPKTKIDWLWSAPEYFSRWRLFPRAFISMYIYLLYSVVEWFMALPDPNMNQAGLVSVVVGAGAAWFGLYVNSVSSSGKDNFSPMMRINHQTTTGMGRQPRTSTRSSMTTGRRTSGSKEQRSRNLGIK